MNLAFANSIQPICVAHMVARVFIYIYIYINCSFAGGGTVLGTLPSTSGLKKTYFLSYQTPSSALPSGNVIRIGGDVAAGNTATLYRVTLTDSLAFNGVSGGTSYKNIGLF